jgi:acyl CoA:acetate/3-ketoacid CoA transferase alpha subunit
MTGNIMIDALIFALAAAAMGIPAIITAATLGSKLEFDW